MTSRAKSLPIALPLAVLGATSQICRDFILTAHAAHGTAFALYARRPPAVAEFVSAHGLSSHWTIGSLDDFARASAASTGRFGAVLNFVGVGDPAKANAMGAGIFAATRDSDRLALDYLQRFPDTPYIFMSSGAVYGTNFDAPISRSSVASIPINALTPQQYYGVAKLYAETMHRALPEYRIFDVRIFNYISRSMDVRARFLITDMIDAIVEDAVFRTSNQPMVRDYLHPQDFCALVMACISAPPGANMPVDAYSRAPVSKAELLALFADRFGLRYEIVSQIAAVNATGAKPFYCSENRAAAALGYMPRYTSIEGITIEVRALLEARG